MPSISLASDLHTLFKITTLADRQDTCIFVDHIGRCASSSDARTLAAGLNVDVLWQWPHIAIQDPRLLEKLQLIGDRFLCTNHTTDRQTKIAGIAQAWLKKVEEEVSKFRKAIASALPEQLQCEDAQMQQMRALLIEFRIHEECFLNQARYERQKPGDLGSLRQRLAQLDVRLQIQDRNGQPSLIAFAQAEGAAGSLPENAGKPDPNNILLVIPLKDIRGYEKGEFHAKHEDEENIADNEASTTATASTIPVDCRCQIYSGRFEHSM